MSIKNHDWIIEDLRLKFKLKCFNQLISFDLYKIGFEGGDEKRASSEKMGGDNKQQRREINSFSSSALFLPMTINNPQAKFSSFSQKQNIWFKVFDESRKIISWPFDFTLISIFIVYTFQLSFFQRLSTTLKPNLARCFYFTYF